MKKYKKLLLVPVLLLLALPLRAEYYSGKIKGKKIQLWLDEQLSQGYFYYFGEKSVYKLLRSNEELSATETGPLFKAYLENTEKLVGDLQVKSELNYLEVVWTPTGTNKPSKTKFKKITLEVQALKTQVSKYINEDCELEYLDLLSIENDQVINRIYMTNQRVMGYYNDFGCTMLKPPKSNLDAFKFSASSPTKAKNKLTCRPEIYILKNRFYGINFYCEGYSKEHPDQIRRKQFIQLYDSELKIEIKKADFTDSDINNEDDNKGLLFGISAIGLFLYYEEDAEKPNSYQNHIPYHKLQKNFKKWGKPKSYLRYLELR